MPRYVTVVGLSNGSYIEVAGEGYFLPASLMYQLFIEDGSLYVDATPFIPDDRGPGLHSMDMDGCSFQYRVDEDSVFELYTGYSWRTMSRGDWVVKLCDGRLISVRPSVFQNHFRAVPSVPSGVTRPEPATPRRYKTRATTAPGMELPANVDAVCQVGIVSPTGGPLLLSLTGRDMVGRAWFADGQLMLVAEAGPSHGRRVDNDGEWVVRFRGLAEPLVYAAADFHRLFTPEDDEEGAATPPPPPAPRWEVNAADYRNSAQPNDLDVRIRLSASVTSGWITVPVLRTRLAGGGYAVAVEAVTIRELAASEAWPAWLSREARAGGWLYSVSYENGQPQYCREGDWVVSFTDSSRRVFTEESFHSLVFPWGSIPSLGPDTPVGSVPTSSYSPGSWDDELEARVAAQTTTPPGPRGYEVAVQTTPAVLVTNTILRVGFPPLIAGGAVEYREVDFGEMADRARWGGTVLHLTVDAQRIVAGQPLPEGVSRGSNRYRLAASADEEGLRYELVDEGSWVVRAPGMAPFVYDHERFIRCFEEVGVAAAEAPPRSTSIHATMRTGAVVAEQMTTTSVPDGVRADDDGSGRGTYYVARQRVDLSNWVVQFPGGGYAVLPDDVFRQWFSRLDLAEEEPQRDTVPLYDGSRWEDIV